MNKVKIEFPDLMYDSRSGKISIRSVDSRINEVYGILPYGNPLIHIKSGNKYYYQCIVLNATNSNDGQFMVEYINEYKDRFVREINEFCDKFSADLSEIMI